MNEKDKNKIDRDRGTKRKSPESEDEANEENESKESSPFNGILIEDDDDSARSKLQKFNDCIDISTVFKSIQCQSFLGDILKFLKAVL